MWLDERVTCVPAPVEGLDKELDFLFELDLSRFFRAASAVTIDI